MKRFWILAILMFLLVIPIDPYNNVAGKTISISEAPGDVLARVYGKDYSDEVYRDVSLPEYKNIVQKFTENGSRWIMDYTMASNGANMYARNYIIEQLEQLSQGRIETEVIGNCLNVVGRLPGYLPGDNNPAFAISAHYDSAEGSSGANCDGSGIAAVLELARVLSKYEWPLDIYFIAFNGLLTMTGMEGSPQVANAFNNRGIDFLMLYNVDTLLVQDFTAPLDERIQFGYAVGTYQNGRYWAELARQMSNNIGTNKIVPIPASSFYLWSSSDHYAFYQRGFSNLICAFESGIAVDGSYQNSNDRWTNGDYNYALGRETTAVIGASIAFAMSRALGKPTISNHEFSLGSGLWEPIYITVSTPTFVNVSARWYGGISSFYLVNPDNTVIASLEFNDTSAWEASDILSRYVTQVGQYTLWVYNSDYRPVGYDVEVSIEADIDGNGVLDSDEYWINPALFNSDQDSDGLSDAEEILLGTNLNSVDTDNDAMPDKYEVDNGFDPRDPSDGSEDADMDGLTNAQEYTGGLNPFSADSDNDRMPDLWELENGLNPLVDDANQDLDGDGISNLQEYLDGTNPQEPQTMEIPTEVYLAPVLVIAVIGAFVYIRKRKDPWN
jgi:hypothetical protein